MSRDFQGQIRGKIGRFRGILAEKIQISKDFQGQILRKIGRFHRKFQGETSPRNNQYGFRVITDSIQRKTKAHVKSKVMTSNMVLKKAARHMKW